MKIGMLCIATNKYIRFVEPLFCSMRKHFLCNHDVDMFVFTNQKAPNGVVRVEQSHMPWPGPTLKRYEIFCSNERLFSSLDYLFYCDADMLFVSNVGDEVLGSGLTATIHPGFYNKQRSDFSYETNPKSLAYISLGQGAKYYAGGFQGGKKDIFLSAMQQMRQNIETDQANGIVACWHDESHWNRFLVSNPPSVELSPAYCYPESWTLPFSKKLLALDKNHAEMRA